MKNRSAIVPFLGLSLLVGGCGGAKLADEDRQLEEAFHQLLRRLHEIEHAQAVQQQERPDLVPVRLLALSPDAKSRMHLQLLDFSGPSPFGAEKMALADLEAGHRNLLTGGLNLYSDEVRDFLRDEYHIQVYDIAFCTDGTAIFDFIHRYNEPVETAIERDTGKSYRDILVEAGAFGAE
ncbi:MAG: hypothetical protein CMJ49_09315 [Planctomycetaceae bacterium]|nr:hypothetical protein [Planctomycetaceae bacterium]